MLLYNCRHSSSSGDGPQGVLSLLAALVVVTLLTGCSSPSADSEPVDLAVRVYVDRDASGTWTERDVPLPDITVSLDGKSTAISGQDGLARFESVSRKRHTLALDDQDIAELASHSLISESGSQTVQVDGNMEIGFRFAAKSFLEVDVAEEEQGE
ncbi:hypothetical protein ACFLS0_04160 [Candidatus Bipolaricaulota bacterium]